MRVGAALVALACLCACDDSNLPVGPVDGGPGAPGEADARPIPPGPHPDATAATDGTISPILDATAAVIDGGAQPGPDGGTPPGADAQPRPDATAADSGVPAERALYVAPNGNDANPGTLAQPLRTVAEGLRRAQPGETVRLRAGTYNELASFPRSGLPGQPITLAAMPGERAVLDGSGLGRGLGEPGLIMIVDRDHIVVRGLELTGLDGTLADFPSGIWVYGTTRDIVLEDNLVHDIRAFGGGLDSGAHGIAVYGLEPIPSEDIVIRGNEVRDLTLGWSEAVVINGNVRRFLVEDNHVHHVDNIAFDAIGFEENVCPSCDQDDVISDDVNRARDGRFVGNLAHDMSTLANPAYQGDRAAACFYVDGGADIVIERNVAHDCDLGVELASEHFDKSTRRVIVRSNLLYANWVTGVATGGYSSGNGFGGGSAEDCLIVHNTIYDSARSGWADAGILLQNRNRRNLYANNIIVATPGTYTISNIGAQNNANVFLGNIDFGGDVENVTRGMGSQRNDPMLMNPILGDFHLRPGSPARNAGVVLTLPQFGVYDFEGDARLQGFGLDIGADESP